MNSFINLMKETELLKIMQIYNKSRRSSSDAVLLFIKQDISIQSDQLNKCCTISLFV